MLPNELDRYPIILNAIDYLQFATNNQNIYTQQSRNRMQRDIIYNTFERMEGFYLSHCRFKDIIIKKVRIIWIFLVSIRYKRTNIRF